MNSLYISSHKTHLNRQAYTWIDSNDCMIISVSVHYNEFITQKHVNAIQLI